MVKKFENLHTHTYTSDGKLTYRQTLKVCSENNIGTVAFTDHDSLPSEKDLHTLENNSSGAVKWILGLEISSGLPIELGGKPTSNFHIIGLFIDPFNQALKNYCQKMQLSRLERMEKIVNNLQKIGFRITKNDCLAESKGKTISRPHMVAALHRKNNNLDLIEKLIKELAADKTPKAKKIYKNLVKKGSDQYLYGLFLEKGSYIPNIYVDYIYGLDLDKTVSLIRKAGGVAILAHWTFCKNIISLKTLRKLLESKRIDGVETVYNFNAKGMKNRILTDMKIMNDLTEKAACLKSGGADSHNRQQIIDFYKNNEIARKTIGFAENIVKKGQVDTRWSSF